MKGTLVVSAIVHAVFLALVIGPAFQGRGAVPIDIINVSLLGGGGGGPAPAAQTKMEATKEPEAKEPPSKMAYKPAAENKSSKKDKSKTSKASTSASKATTGQKGPSSGTGTGTGTGKGSGTGSGSGIKLDDESFRFAYYLEVLRERIGYTWAPPMLFGVKNEVVATVYFKIARDGSISDEKIEKTSDQELFDRAALRAIKLADPLPPLPAGFKGKYLGVHFEFQHTPG
jgi:protein TonB